VGFSDADFDDPAAVAAAEAAAHMGRSPTLEGMLEAMEAAEGRYDAQAGAPAAACPPPTTAEHARAAQVASPAVRARVVGRLREALAHNPRVGGPGAAAAAAAECEAAIFAKCRSHSVYQSVTSNAVRVGGAGAGVEELLRIASGGPRAGGGGGGEAQPYVSGLQGLVVKPSQTTGPHNT
jgi:hypothetical protein